MRSEEILTESDGGRDRPIPAPDGSDLVARVEGLRVLFRRRGEDLAAVKGISLEIRRGEILGVVGESGCGKTTFGLALTGLLCDQPDPPRVTGSIEVLGSDLLSATPSARRELRRTDLAAVFQDPTTSLNPTMTIGRQLAEVSPSEEERSRLLESVGVTPASRRLRSYPHELSGGQRQRVMIASALARNPALVVADEPTTALDVTIQAQLLGLIARLRDETNTALVLVTHDLGVAAQIADRIAVLYAGRLVELGPARQVLEDPAHPYTIGLMRSRIAMMADRSRPLPELAGEPPRPQTDSDGCPFAPRCEFVQPQCLIDLPVLEGVRGRPLLAACVRASELEAGEVSDSAPPWRPASEETRAVAVQLEAVEKVFDLRGRSSRQERLYALRSVDLDVRSGECLGIVGETGCGKSTLLRLIAGLSKLDRGSCSLSPDDEVQMVFQGAASSLTPWLTVGELIGDRLRGMGKKARQNAVADALRAVGLAEDLAHAKSRHLSGGQRQRVALARAVVVPPRILLCDEPTSSLDAPLAASVLNLIGALRRKLGMTVVFVTHDLAAARAICDRIAVMYLGRIVEIGPAGAVTETPGHPYTKALIAAVPEIGRARVQAKGELPDPLHPPSGCHYHPRCVEAIGQCSHVDPPLEAFGNGTERSGACVHLGS